MHRIFGHGLRAVLALMLGWSAHSLMSASSAAGRASAIQAPGLKIIVIAGEDAVNVIQQKTAVAPIVEVRDRNDQPVAGAVVNFAIRGGRATFGGARTLAVTTDIAGRAVATGLTPTASGALQISASAAFQGQTAAITIAQTNVMTAAQAAAVSSAGSTGGAASGTGAGAGGGSGTGATAGAGAGGGGGLSATTLGIIGGAAAGGAVVATKALSGPSGTAYTGQFSGDVVLPPNTGFCGFTARISAGTLTIFIEQIDASSARGSAKVADTNSTIYNASCGLPSPGPSFQESTDIPSLTGTSSNLGFDQQRTNNFTAPNGQAGVRTQTLNFVGSFNGSEIVGVLSISEANRPPSSPGPTGSGTGQFSVTLR